jgi:hypothetical protein
METTVCRSVASRARCGGEVRSLRRCIEATLYLIAVLSLLVGPVYGQPSNPIVIENQQPGTNLWQIPYGSAGTDAGGQVKGYASDTSVNKGQNITFYVSVSPAQTYTIDVFRMGWYQGLGGRLMQHIGPLSGVKQATCPTDPSTGMIECHWTPVYTLATQTSWTSGIYLALLKNAQGYQNYIEFALRDDSRVAALLYQQPVLTYEAYNDYPYDNATGKSLYDFNSYGANTVSGTPRAVKASFDRPYMSDGTNLTWGQSFFDWEYSFVRWMEMSGYDVTYSTDIDTHLNGSRLRNYRGILSVGHDEYWTREMYDAFYAARDGGVNLGFFGANMNGRQVRIEASSSGAQNRVVVYYASANLDPVADRTLITTDWSDPALNRPEQTLVGAMYIGQVLWSPQYDGYAPFVVTNSANWVYAGTGFRDSDSVPGIVGYECDRLRNEYPPPNAITGTYTLLSNSPFNTNVGTSVYSNAAVYQAQSGAWVFATGTMGWSRALDNYAGRNVVDTRIQQVTANVLNRFVTPLLGFSITASPSSQTVTQGNSTSYSVTIGRTGGFTGQVTLSVSGLPSGANGSFSPNPATASSTLSITTSTSTPAGTYTLTITGVSGTLTNTTTVALVVNPLPDFALSASPSSRMINPGGVASYSVTISPVGGFSNQVTLTASGLPGGANGSFSPNPATGSSTLSVTTSTSTPPATYTLTITGVSGSLTHATTISLVVVMPDFTLSASPSSQTVTQGRSTSYSITIIPVTGFTGQVTLNASGLPGGANGSFSPNPATGSSTLSVTTAMSTPPATYTLTITGVSGSLTHTAVVSLTVNRPGVKYDNAVSSDYHFGTTSITTPPFVIGSAANGAAMIFVTMSASNATGITATLGGVSGTLIAGTDTATMSSSGTDVSAISSRTMIFCVANPPPGSQTATVSWTTSMDADVGVITVSGANQTIPCNNGTFVAEVPNGLTSSVTIASNYGDLTASSAATGGNWSASPTNQTVRWIDGFSIGGDTGPGTGTTTHTWTDQWPGEPHTVSGANFSAF